MIGFIISYGNANINPINLLVGFINLYVNPNFNPQLILVINEDQNRPTL